MSAADRCENGWRWRAGAYRVLTLAKNSVAVIELFHIGHRREVYRRL